MQFYNVKHNSFYKNGFPWGMTMDGEILYERCEECGCNIFKPFGDIEISLERAKGSKWPDVLGGAHLLLTVSEKVLRDWEAEGVGGFPVHKVTIKEPYPKKLEGTVPPEYFWIDGSKMCGALMDFEKSGYVFKGHCIGCNRRIEDIDKTYEKRNSNISPDVIMPESWSGMHLFTTNLGDRSFFCTQFILELAGKYRHTNFRFTPIEIGSDSGHKGIDYLRKR